MLDRSEICATSVAPPISSSTSFLVGDTVVVTSGVGVVMANSELMLVAKSSSGENVIEGRCVVVWKRIVTATEHKH